MKVTVLPILIALTLALVLVTGMSAPAFARSASSLTGSPPEPKFSDQSFETLGLPYQNGDIFAATVNGLIKVFRPDGTFVQTLDTTSGALEQTGMCLDSSGNLRSTNFDSSTMTLFDNSGTVTTFPWAGPFNEDPESCVIDAAGNIYVGQADGTGDILKFNPAGTLLDSFDVATTDRGSDWIDLAADQCTMFYTSEGSTIKRYDVCTDTQLADFKTGLPDPSCYALRIRSNGEVMVACSSSAFQINPDGTTGNSYPAAGFNPAANFLFALNLGLDGTSFWTADIDTAQIYHIDIATGNQLGTFNAADPGGIGGLAIFGEPTGAMCPPGTHGTPPNCIPNTTVCPPGTHGTPPNCIPNTTVIGGEIIPINTTALLIANAQSTSWMIPIVLSVLGIGLFVVSRKSENS